jgi:Histone RNA hairpin-binding protein RNA-binding domain
VPKAERSTESAEHPQTPNPHVRRSKRAFEGLLTVWRRQLHAWDPPVSSDEVLAMPLAPAVDTSQGFTDGDSSSSATAMDVVGSEDAVTSGTAATAAVTAAAVAAATAVAVSRELSAAVDIYGEGEIDGDEFGGDSSTADSSNAKSDIFGTREDCELPSDDDEDDDLL